MKIHNLLKIIILASKIYYLINLLSFIKKGNVKNKNQNNAMKFVKILWLIKITKFLRPFIYILKKVFVVNICNKKFLSMIFIMALCSNLALGVDKKLPLPRFASIKANEVNARNGPAIKSPIEWVFVKKGEPVEIIAEYDQWRQIRDIKGEGGWVHSSVLSGKRSIITIGSKVIMLHKNPQKTEDIVAQVHPDVRCQLQKCKGDWCKIQCITHVGWILKKQIWGVYPSE